MKRILIFIILAISALRLSGQAVYQPNVAIKPIATLSVTSVVTNDSTTTVGIRIVNAKQLPPFTIRTRELYIRPVGEPQRLKLLKSVNAPFAPEKHVFTSPQEQFDFSLVFQALPKGTKYFDLLEDMKDRQFYIQGIILDPKMNEMVTRGFDSFARADGNGALKAFIEMAEYDLYFEYGMAYFNIIYLLTASNRIGEAQVWYDKFKDRFFYDKKLLENEMARLGISQKLK